MVKESFQIVLSCVTWVEAMMLKPYTQGILIRKNEYSRTMIGNGFSVTLFSKHGNNTVLETTINVKSKSLEKCIPLRGKKCSALMVHHVLIHDFSWMV